jgi:hypothetical protein
LRDALFLFDPESIHDVYVVPNFISEGYFTQTVVPRELELNGRITERSNGQIWKYCEPVGSHSSMTDLLLQRARHIAPDVDPAETSLLIVAHGTDLNENSAVAAKREAEKIRALGKYATVLNVYMEEPPLVADWRKSTETPNVIVVPFFISLQDRWSLLILCAVHRHRSWFRRNHYRAGRKLLRNAGKPEYLRNLRAFLLSLAIIFVHKKLKSRSRLFSFCTTLLSRE